MVVAASDQLGYVQASHLCPPPPPPHPPTHTATTTPFHISPPFQHCPVSPPFQHHLCDLAEDRVMSGVTDMAFSKTGRLLIASYQDSFCIAWETIARDGTWYELKGHRSRVSCIGVNSTGQALSTGSWDSVLCIWA